MIEAWWSAMRVTRELGRYDCVVRSCATHEETGLEQRNGSRSSLVTNPDSFSAVVRLVFVCGDPVVNASILPLLYRDTSLPPLVLLYEVPLLIQYTVIPIIDLWHHDNQWYVHDILQPHVLPLMQQLPGAIYQQNNTHPHTARVSLDCLRTITTLPLPARFPDLSSIEHIWYSGSVICSSH
ncbi:l-Fucosyltransferase [Trichonephila clavipes]|nr:l-Fucosyltransferase [Trichonephila clavipes]